MDRSCTRSARLSRSGIRSLIQILNRRGALWIRLWKDFRIWTTSPTSFSKNLDEEENDFSDSVLKYINQVLMEDVDDLEDKACLIQDSTLHVAEKSFYDVLVDKNPQSPTQPLPHHHGTVSTDASVSYSRSNCSAEFKGGAGEIKKVGQGCECETFDFENKGVVHYEVKKMSLEGKTGEEKGEGDFPKGLIRGRESTLGEDEIDLDEGRSNKHLAVYAEESVLRDMFEKILVFNGEEEEAPSNSVDGSSGGMSFTNKRTSKREAVDTRSLLIQCMNSIANNDHRSADNLLKQIRNRSSPTGDSSQRLAHCFANALEARLAGTANRIYKDLSATNLLTSDAFRAYKLYMAAFPFMKASSYFATQTFSDVAEKATTLHVIHFGLMHGIHIPPLIQHLVKRPGGPPKLRVTGIDFPQPGFRPDAFAEETGRRLANYCGRFNVPFEFNAIVQKWETIRPEDLKIEKDEVLVVYSSCKFQVLLDDTILENSSRDAVLNLVKRLRPDVFIHGVHNGAYNSPFFVSRFREALFYFSALFDMFEACVPRENQERIKFETEMYGREVLNVIACEGLERVERPESYKQWHVRMLRAGLKQLPLNKEIMKKVEAKVKSSYHKNFFVDEGSQWMLQGWRGRVLFAMSCWKAA